MLGTDITLIFLLSLLWVGAIIVTELEVPSAVRHTAAKSNYDINCVVHPDIGEILRFIHRGQGFYVIHRPTQNLREKFEPRSHDFRVHVPNHLIKPLSING